MRDMHAALPSYGTVTQNGGVHPGRLTRHSATTVRISSSDRMSIPCCARKSGDRYVRGGSTDSYSESDDRFVHVISVRKQPPMKHLAAAACLVKSLVEIVEVVPLWHGLAGLAPRR